MIHHRPEISKGQLDFGTLAMGEKRIMNFTLRNENPVDVRSCTFFVGKIFTWLYICTCVSFYSIWVDTISALSAGCRFLLASFQKNAHLMGRLGSGPLFVGRIRSGSRLVGRLGSGVLVSASLKKCPPRGSVMVKTPHRGRQGWCSASQQGWPCRLADRVDVVFTHIPFYWMTDKYRHQSTNETY